MGFLKTLLNCFFPVRCVVCDGLTGSSEIICENCAGLFYNYKAVKNPCKICLRPPAECVCGKRTLYSKHVSPFFNEGDARTSLYALKFGDRRDKLKPFAEMMRRELENTSLLDGIDYVTYIPMTKRREKKRGFNLAYELAAEISKETDLPCVKLLDKICETPQQHSLGAIGRTGNLLGAFEPTSEAKKIIAGKKILLTDDILTGGSTFNEAAKTLYIFGADEVRCVSALTTRKKIRG